MRSASVAAIKSAIPDFHKSEVYHLIPTPVFSCILGLLAKPQPCGYKWSTFRLTKCTKSPNGYRFRLTGFWEVVTNSGSSLDLGNTACLIFTALCGSITISLACHVYADSFLVFHLLLFAPYCLVYYCVLMPLALGFQRHY